MRLLMTTATYQCVPGSDLFAVLAEAHSEGASDVQVGQSNHAPPNLKDRWYWARIRVGGTLYPLAIIPAGPKQMVEHLIASPPLGLTDPVEQVLHALGAVASEDMDLSAVTDIDGEIVRWRMNYFDGTLVARRIPAATVSEVAVAADVLAGR